MSRHLISISFFFLFLLCPCQPTQGQASTQPPTAKDGEHRKTSEPYTGDLSIFDSPGRDDRLQINRVMDILGISQGKIVADIGAGSGWFTVRAAKRVGGTGFVFAVDINPEVMGTTGSRAALYGFGSASLIKLKMCSARAIASRACPSTSDGPVNLRDRSSIAARASLI